MLEPPFVYWDFLSDSRMFFVAQQYGGMLRETLGVGRDSWLSLVHCSVLCVELVRIC